jgi:glycosyltransferase involved in cell wall biosynthesis
MRILLLMDPFIRVPPEHYGGIERVIADLADGLVARGHDVTLWAAPESRSRARLEAFGREGEWTRWSNLRNTVVVTGRFWRHHGRFDLVHNFGRLAYLTGIIRSAVPKVQTYMRPVNPRNMRKVRALGAHRLRFTAVSAAIRDTGAVGGGEWSVIYNCARVADFTPRLDTDATTSPLVFLGRLERCKGAHTAIRVARRLGRPLVIAGNISTLSHEREYYEREVAPQVDGERIRYDGVVNTARKNALLGSAAALLLPVVLPEALLCGTPVVAFSRGGIPEGIDEGRTGFLCTNEDEMVAAVRRLPEISRATCRAEAVRRFSDDAVVSDYERLYQEVINGPVPEAESCARGRGRGDEGRMRKAVGTPMMRVGVPGSPARVFQRDGVAVGPREK